MPIRTMRTLDIKIEWMQFVRTRTRRDRRLSSHPRIDYAIMALGRPRITLDESAPIGSIDSTFRPGNAS
jgi:hypothetical protein